MTEKELQDRRTDILTLCERIKDAFMEGCDAGFDAGNEDSDRCSTCHMDEYAAWNDSEAKRIHDILRKQAMEQ